MRTSIARPAQAAMLAVALLGNAMAAGAQKAPDSVSKRQPGQLEQRVRERIATVVQKRLELTDDQMKRLRDVNS